MKSIYKHIAYLFAACAILSSCEDEDNRTEYPSSTPIIESASINPVPFYYGDSITLNAKLADSSAPLSTIEIKMVANDVLISNQVIRTKGNSLDLSAKVATHFTDQLPDGTNVEVLLKLTNVEGGESVSNIANVTAKRRYFSKLYLILETEEVIELTPQAANKDLYETTDIKIKSKSVRYKIAEKITADNLIDYSGWVWGNDGNSTQLIDETGDFITAENKGVDYITKIVFDNYSFVSSVIGAVYNANDLVLDSFNDVTLNNEAYKKLSRSFSKGQEVTLYNDLADDDVIFNMDYFNRTATDKIVFSGETGNYDLYYSAKRKYVLIVPEKREFPDVLLAAGMGMGNLSKIMPTTTSGWGFDMPFQGMIFKRVATNVYQGTIYIDAANLNFKFFENSGWGNEKKSTDYTMPSILAKDTDLGKTDGNWYPSATAISGNYKITINLATKVVTAESVTL